MSMSLHKVKFEHVVSALSEEEVEFLMRFLDDTGTITLSSRSLDEMLEHRFPKVYPALDRIVKLLRECFWDKDTPVSFMIF
jgi:hypothetical protein